MDGYENMNLSRNPLEDFLSSGLGPIPILSETAATPLIYKPETTSNFTVIEKIYKYNQDWFRFLGIFIGIVDVVFGTIGNALTILAYAKSRKLRKNVFNLFIVNLSIVDFLTASAMIPFNIAGYVSMQWPFGKDHVTCILQAFFYFSCGYTSVVCLMVITMNRFIGIVFPDRYHTMHSKTRTAITIFLSWTIAPAFLSPFMISSIMSNVKGEPSLTGWKSSEFLCTFVHVKSWKIYMQLVRALFQFLPLLVMIVCYTIMVKRVRASHKRMRDSQLPNYLQYREKMETRQALINRQDQVDSRQHIPEGSIENRVTYKSASAEEIVLTTSGKNADDSSDTSGCLKEILGLCMFWRQNSARINEVNNPVKVRRQRSGSEQLRHDQEQRLMYISVVVCIAFTVLFLPSLIINLPSNSHTFDSRLHMAASNITWLNSCVNPFIYVALHRRMRKQYKDIMKQFIDSILSIVSSNKD